MQPTQTPPRHPEARRMIGVDMRKRWAQITAPCPNCNDEGVFHDMAGNVLGLCDCGA